MMASTPFDTFILKITNRCNIDCDYCYVFNLKDQTSRKRPARLGADIAEATAARIAEHVVSHSIAAIHVVLHGGEPLLAGPRHVRHILETVRRAVPSETQVGFEVQTNATLIKEDWLDLFERYSVHVGISLDGPLGSNDRHRLSHKGRSTYAATVRGIELIKSRQDLFSGILAVVDLVNEPDAVYHELAAFEPPVIDFNFPHATHDDPPYRRQRSAPEYGQWLARIFDLWMADNARCHTIRFLEDIVALSAGARSSVESLGLAPSGIVFIESDGAIESADTLRAVEVGAAGLGLDVFHHTFDDALGHPKIMLRQGGRSTLSDQCQACSLVEVCGGGYLPHRFSSKNGYRNPSVYCPDLMYLIRHVQSSLSRYDPSLLWRFS
jgi:radical SAM/SPASM domain FxsB family protein